MGIIGALYERGAAARVSGKIPRGRRPWNPTLQTNEGWGTRLILTTSEGKCYAQKVKLLLDTPVNDRIGSVKITTWLRGKKWLAAAFVRSSMSSALLHDTPIL
jgi:hypothetical protein